MKHPACGNSEVKSEPITRYSSATSARAAAVVCGLAVLLTGASTRAKEPAADVVGAEPSQAEPLAKRSKAKADGPVVTYTGLRVHEDGSATLRVELSKKVAVEKSGKGTEVRFFLPGARVTIKNNKNPLLAQHFASSIVSAEIVPSKEGVTVVVKLRKPVDLAPQLVEQAGGASTLRVEIPAASKAPTSAPQQ